MTVKHKAFQGGKSVREFHAEHVFAGAKCQVCPAKGIMRAMVFLPLDELRKRDPMFDAVAARNPEGIKSTLVQFRGADGRPAPYVRTRTVYACSVHASELEKTVAKETPSWAVVEIDRGPNEEPILRGWDAELANAHAVARPSEGFRVNDRRHGRAQLAEAPSCAEKTGTQ